MKISAVILAALIFVTSVGVAIDIHYCQGEFKNLSFFKKAKSCHQLAQQSHCSGIKQSCHSKMMTQEIDKSNCCDNESVFLQLETDFSVPSLIDFDYQKFWFALNSNEEFQIDDLSEYYEVAEYKNYKPPLIPLDITIHHQVFII